jgi:sterol desaturase/sphingolipid hydroxylase (fatty acid hydroxylase superfamily)
MDDRLFNLVLLAGLALLVGLELRSPSFRAGSFQKNVRAIRNWSFLAGAIVSSWALRLISAELSAHLAPLFVWGDWVVPNLIGCFLVAELIGWFLHWVKHRNAWLWRFHFQHHRETHYDLWLISHTHALEVVISGTLMSAILILLGFSPLSINAYFLFYALANPYHHSGFDYSLGWLDRIIVSPAYHRLHHAVGSHGNFGNTLTVWDWVFRTATWPDEQSASQLALGIGDGPEPYGFVAEMTWFLEPDALPETSES